MIHCDLNKVMEMLKAEKINHKPNETLPLKKQIEILSLSISLVYLLRNISLVKNFESIALLIKENISACHALKGRVLYDEAALFLDRFVA